MSRLLIAFLCWAIPVASIDPGLSPFIDTTKLQNIASTQSLLFDHGFKKVYFTTSDGVKLCGLFLDQSKTKKITHTIIYCAGFYPGSKEGMSSFYALVASKPYNFLLFDARGHNESQGSLWSYQNLKNYGTVEYLDVIAAINFAAEYNAQHNIHPSIIIHGICSGAFHTIKALESMSANSSKHCSLIKGVVFDSGWLHLPEIMPTIIQTEVSSKLKGGYFAWLTSAATYIVETIYGLLFKKHYEALPSIADAMTKITVPIWFVHCTNDPYIPITSAQKCAKACNAKNCWWIDHDSHANYHTVQHEKYQEKLIEFLGQLSD